VFWMHGVRAARPPALRAVAGQSRGAGCGV